MTTFEEAEANGRSTLEWPPLDLVACALGVIGLVALSAVAVHWNDQLTSQQYALAFAACCAIPFIATWRAAVKDGRLPVLPNGTPKQEHITGLGFVALLFVVSVIIGLASWAATSGGSRTITQDWGVGVVFGLAVTFVIAALAPLGERLRAPGEVNPLGMLLSLLRAALRPFGLVLSFVDSILVFAVAGSAGASQAALLVRYALLIGVLVPCALLGYFVEAPYGLIPIAWGFIVAISISRRWAWVEDDRDLYMLNRRYTGAHLRIGFGQDLRDEALLSFMSMFFLVPLALRQGHNWLDIGSPLLFRVEDHGSLSLLDWIGFYGTELAKAVPFVDWAEVYQVEGRARIEVVHGAGQHVVFATRVLVDLVFLSALLQAISISARNSKQMDLFKAGAMDRLDPFLEPREFRKLLRRPPSGAWEVDADRLREFPKYDPIRLAELSDPQHMPISIAAKALRRRDGSDDSIRFHEQLIERAFQKKKNADAIEEVLTAIRMTAAPIEADDFDRIRIELNGVRSMNAIRETIMKMVVNSPDTPERWAAIKSALVGETTFDHGRGPEYVRDYIAPVRRIALSAVRERALQQSPEAIALIDNVQQNDPAGQLRREADAILVQLRMGASGSS